MLLRLPPGTQTRPLDDVIAAHILGYINRETDTAQVLDAIKARYARALISPADTFEADDSRYALLRDALAKAFDNGSYEVVMLRWLLRVISETATLYTEPGTRYQYAAAGADKPEVGVLINAYREKGGFDLTMPIVDGQAVGIGTSSALLTWEGRRIRYRACPPTHWHAAFADEILDDDRRRPVDGLSLDECTYLTIRLAGQDARSHRRRAQTWFGASEEWPQGRLCVWYCHTITETPPPPGPGISDYTDAGFIDGAPADACRNPLTVAGQDAAGDEHWEQPEYPIAIFYDEHLAQGDRLVRTTGYSRYHESLEFDLAASRLLGSGLRSARGAWVLSNPQGGPLPQGWDEGMVQVFREQTVQLLSHSAVNSLDAHKLLSQLARAVAEADGVAGYAVQPDTTDSMSGRAIIAASAPQHRRRHGRIKTNRASQARIFALERLWLRASGAPDEAIPWEVEETWIPGDISIPGDPEADQRTRSGDLKDRVIDLVEAVRQAQNLATREDAKRMIDEMTADAAEKPEYGAPAAAAPAGPASPLMARLRARANGG